MRAFAWLVALPIAGACSGPSEYELCVGVQSEPLPGVQRVRVTTTTPEGPKSETVDFAVLPKEMWARSRASDPQLGVLVEALDAQGGVVLTRTARAPMPAASPEKKLLRVRLSSICIPPAGPSCAGGQTCIAGRCQDDHLLPSDLEIYQPNWSIDVPDVCRPANAGAPEVIVGTGQTDYLPLAPGQVVTAERGPQGGHHLYVALRQRNLRRSGSTTTITGRRPDTMVDIPPTAFVFTFDVDEGGYCKLSGLRYQLDNGGIDYKQFLDHDLDVTVTVRDSAGTVGTGTTRVHVAPTVIGE